MDQMFIASAQKQNAPPTQVAEVVTLNVKLTDLNSVTQKVFGGITDKLANSKVILRCDVLPQVNADEADMVQLFRKLLDMILCCPLPDSKLFIYLKCKPAPNDVVDLGLAPGCALLQIDICTNSKAGAVWAEEQATILEQCNDLCNKNKAEFTYNTFNETGSLFTITLSGKLNTATIG